MTFTIIILLFSQWAGVITVYASSNHKEKNPIGSNWRTNSDHQFTIREIPEKDIKQKFGFTNINPQNIAMGDYQKVNKSIYSNVNKQNFFFGGMFEFLLFFLNIFT